MGKISGYTPDSSLDDNHYVPVIDPSGPTTFRTLLSVLKNFLFDQDNIPSVSGSPVLRASERWYDFVASGLEWTPDDPGVDRNASMSTGVVYASGKRYSVSAVAGRTFTASKDTYVTILSSGTVDYAEVANGATAPTYAAGAVPIALVVTDGTSVTTVIALAPRAPDEIARARVDYTAAGEGSLAAVNIPAKKYLEFTAVGIAITSTLDTLLYFNGDTGTTYAWRGSVGETTLSESVSNAGLSIESGATDAGQLQQWNMTVINIQDQEKSYIFDNVSQDGPGGGTYPTSITRKGKWANTTDQITLVDWTDISGDNFDVGSEIIVKGRD